MIFLITLIVLLTLMVIEGNSARSNTGSNRARTAAQK
jgi:hypothetical protein